MLTTGIVLLVLGALIFGVFFWLNLNSPLQTPFPLVGIGVGLIGFVLLILAIGKML